jgi:hypothetical protein
MSSKGAPLEAKWRCFADRRRACAPSEASHRPCSRSLPLPKVSFRQLLRTSKDSARRTAGQTCVRRHPALARLPVSARQRGAQRRHWIGAASPPNLGRRQRTHAGCSPAPRFSLAVEWRICRSWTVHHLNGRAGWVPRQLKLASPWILPSAASPIFQSCHLLYLLTDFASVSRVPYPHLYLHLASSQAKPVRRL